MLFRSRTIVNLLVDQIEFANVIILNKTDLISEIQLQYLKATITKLNPVAKIITSVLGKVDPKEIINTGLFDYEEAENISRLDTRTRRNTHSRNRRIRNKFVRL